VPFARQCEVARLESLTRQRPKSADAQGRTVRHTRLENHKPGRLRTHVAGRSGRIASEYVGAARLTGAAHESPGTLKLLLRISPQSG